MPTICQLCHLHPATVHLTEIDPAGSKQELHVCPLCIQAHGLDLTSPPPLAALTAQPGAADQQTGAITEELCPACGLSIADYRQNNILGCASCIAAFDRPFMDLVAKHQGATRHVGRLPMVPGAEVEAATVSRPRRSTLMRQLNTAIACEDFAVAARLRDQLKQLDEAAP